MGTAWTYSKDVAQDHVAIRTKAGLMDVSGLKKLHLVGPHSSAILNYNQTFNPAVQSGPGAWLQPLAILTPRFVRISTQLDF